MRSHTGTANRKRSTVRRRGLRIGPATRPANSLRQKLEGCLETLPATAASVCAFSAPRCLTTTYPPMAAATMVVAIIAFWIVVIVIIVIAVVRVKVLPAVPARTDAKPSVRRLGRFLWSEHFHRVVNLVRLLLAVGGHLFGGEEGLEDFHFLLQLSLL
jgi:hypothetical protein